MELLGKKLGMTQVFDAQGNCVGVTVVQAGPCTVLQKKTVQTDGYEAYQLGFGERKPKHATKALIGHCRKAQVAPAQTLHEFRHDGTLALNVGDQVTVKVFQPGQYVDVIGFTKGKGFQGVVRRHKFAGGPMTHGNKGWKRRTGAIGERLTPGRVFRGQRMPGHMGQRRVTTQNLRVVQVREADHVILIEGALPGPRGAVLVVRSAKKKPTKA